jgi:hypothetical protein
VAPPLSVSTDQATSPGTTARSFRGRLLVAGVAAGWGILILLGGVAGILTGWSLLGLLGIVPPPAPGGKELNPPELASTGVAGATFLLATGTVALAAFTRRSIELGRAELSLAEASLKAVEEQANKMAEQVTATLAQVAATQAQVTATQAQAEVARQTLEASFRPSLVDVPKGPATRYSPMAGQVPAFEIVMAMSQSGAVVVEVPLRNIGVGPAVITKAMISVGQLHDTAAALTSSIVAVGESVLIGFEIKPKGAALINLASQIAAIKPCVITVFYHGQGGSGSWRSRVSLHALNANRYDVARVELYVGDEIVPFAATGPA